MSDAQTIENLNALLAIRNEQVDKLQAKVDDLKTQIEYGVEWMLQERGTSDGGLPVPRVELALTEDSGYSQEYAVVLVHQHSDGMFSRVPLAYSRRSGGPLDLSQVPTQGDFEAPRYLSMSNLVVDLFTVMNNLQLPAFVVYDQEHRYEVVGRRPTVLRCVPQEVASEANA